MRATTSRKRFLTGGAVALAGVSIVPRPARAATSQTFQWKFGIDTPTDHPIAVRAVEAFAKVRKETNGRLEIRVFPNSVLGGDPAMLTQLRSGALEMLAYAGGILDTLVPVASIENVAFAFPDRRTAFAAMDGDLGAIIRRSIIEKGIMVTDRVWENGFREFTTSPRPIRTVDDLQGLRLRVSPGKLRVDTFRSLGAAVTPIAPNELYTALQTHVVDGQETALPLIETQRLYEVQRYCSLSNHMWSGYWTLINMEKWNALPRDLQESLRRNLNAATELQRRDDEVLNRSIEDKLQRQGLIFNAVDRAGFKARLVSTGYYGRWRDEFGPTAWSALEKYVGRLG